MAHARALLVAAATGKDVTQVAQAWAPSSSSTSSSFVSEDVKWAASWQASAAASGWQAQNKVAPQAKTMAQDRHDNGNDFGLSLQVLTASPSSSGNSASSRSSEHSARSSSPSKSPSASVPSASGAQEDSPAMLGGAMFKLSLDGAVQPSTPESKTELPRQRPTPAAASSSSSSSSTSSLLLAQSAAAEQPLSIRLYPAALHHPPLHPVHKRSSSSGHALQAASAASFSRASTSSSAQHRALALPQRRRSEGSSRANVVAALRTPLLHGLPAPNVPITPLMLPRGAQHASVPSVAAASASKRSRSAEGARRHARKASPTAAAADASDAAAASSSCSKKKTATSSKKSSKKGTSLLQLHRGHSHPAASASASALLPFVATASSPSSSSASVAVAPAPAVPETTTTSNFNPYGFSQALNSTSSWNSVWPMPSPSPSVNVSQSTSSQEEQAVTVHLPQNGSSSAPSASPESLASSPRTPHRAVVFPNGSKTGNGASSVSAWFDSYESLFHSFSADVSEFGAYVVEMMREAARPSSSSPSAAVGWFAVPSVRAEALHAVRALELCMQVLDEYAPLGARLAQMARDKAARAARIAEHGGSLSQETEAALVRQAWRAEASARYAHPVDVSELLHWRTLLRGAELAVASWSASEWSQAEVSHESSAALVSARMLDVSDRISALHDLIDKIARMQLVPTSAQMAQRSPDTVYGQVVSFTPPSSLTSAAEHAMKDEMILLQSTLSSLFHVFPVLAGHQRVDRERHHPELAAWESLRAEQLRSGSPSPSTTSGPQKLLHSLASTTETRIAASKKIVEEVEEEETVPASEVAPAPAAEVDQKEEVLPLPSSTEVHKSLSSSMGLVSVATAASSVSPVDAAPVEPISSSSIATATATAAPEPVVAKAQPATPEVAVPSSQLSAHANFLLSLVAPDNVASGDSASAQSTEQPRLESAAMSSAPVVSSVAESDVDVMGRPMVSRELSHPSPPQTTTNLPMGPLRDSAFAFGTPEHAQHQLRYAPSSVISNGEMVPPPGAELAGAAGPRPIPPLPPVEPKKRSWLVRFLCCGAASAEAEDGAGYPRMGHPDWSHSSAMDSSAMSVPTSHVAAGPLGLPFAVTRSEGPVNSEEVETRRVQRRALLDMQMQEEQERQQAAQMQMQMQQKDKDHAGWHPADIEAVVVPGHQLQHQHMGMMGVQQFQQKQLQQQQQYQPMQLKQFPGEAAYHQQQQYATVGLHQ